MFGFVTGGGLPGELCMTGGLEEELEVGGFAGVEAGGAFAGVEAGGGGGGGGAE